MKCDFCEFEDNVSKLNKEGHPDKWLKVKIPDYEALEACPKCARLILMATYICDLSKYHDNPFKHNKPNVETFALHKYIPGLKKETKKDDNKESEVDVDNE